MSGSKYDYGCCKKNQINKLMPINRIKSKPGRYEAHPVVILSLINPESLLVFTRYINYYK